MHFDFLIDKRPVSAQVRRRDNLRKWKEYVRECAGRKWNKEIFRDENLQLTLVYLYGEDPVDTDNIIKPIQDALMGLVYEDDSLITDVDSHRRPLYGSFEPFMYPDGLIDGILSGEECVYVRVRVSRDLEEYL